MLGKLKNWLSGEDEGIDYEDFNTHISPSNTIVVYCCPGCGSPKVRRKRGENPKWMCTNKSCRYNRKENGGRRTSIWNNSTWKLDRYEVEEYKRKFL